MWLRSRIQYTRGMSVLSNLGPRWNNPVVEYGSVEVEKEMQWFNYLHIFFV